MSHRHTYKPVTTGVPQQTATNPWGDIATATNPESKSVNAHHHVYKPVTAGAQQQVATNPWDNIPVVPSPSSHAPSSNLVQAFYPLVYPALFWASPTPMHYPGQPSVQFYTSHPAAEPVNVNQSPGAHAHYGQGSSGGQGSSQQNPIQLVPQTPSPTDKLYCRQLDGSYTLETVNKIMQELQPGYWKKSSSGFPYWVRTA